MSLRFEREEREAESEERRKRGGQTLLQACD